MFGWTCGVGVGVGERRKWRRTNGCGERWTLHGKRKAVSTVADGGDGGDIQPYGGVRLFLLLLLLLVLGCTDGEGIRW